MNYSHGHSRTTTGIAAHLAQEKNSSLGLIWHLLNPILMTVVLFTVFRNIERLREIDHYQLFILIGLIQYNFFINSTMRSSAYFLGSRSLILTLPFPFNCWCCVKPVSRG